MTLFENASSSSFSSETLMVKVWNKTSKKRPLCFSFYSSRHTCTFIFAYGWNGWIRAVNERFHHRLICRLYSLKTRLISKMIENCVPPSPKFQGNIFSLCISYLLPISSHKRSPIVLTFCFVWGTVKKKNPQRYFVYYEGRWRSLISQVGTREGFTFQLRDHLQITVPLTHSHHLNTHPASTTENRYY